MRQYFASVLHLRQYSASGFHAGAFAEFKFKKWSVEPGLFYTVKGYKATSNVVQTTPGGTFNISISGIQTYQYIELPVNLLYNFKIKPGKIFIGGGPYTGYLLSAIGKRNTTTNGTNVYTETKFDIGGDGNFKRNDFGLGGRAGMAFKNGLQFSAGASFGFTNIVIHNINNNPSVTKNRVLSFSVGYLF